MRKFLAALFSLVMLGAVVTAGAMKMSFWALPAFVAIFFVLGLAQKWSMIRMMAAMLSAPKMVLSVLAQVIGAGLLVSILYFIAYGIAVLVTGSSAVSPTFGEYELIAVGVCFAGGLLGLFAMPKKAPGDSMADMMARLQRMTDGRTTDGTPFPAPANAPAFGVGTSGDVSKGKMIVDGVSGVSPGGSDSRNVVSAVTGAVLTADAVNADDVLSEDSYEVLMDDLQDMAESGDVAPAKLYELARRLAYLPDIADAMETVGSQLALHENANLRRIVQMTLRFLDHSGVDRAVLRPIAGLGLEDPDPWVRFDALRAVDVLGFADPEVAAKITDLSEGVVAPPLNQRIAPDDAEEQARVRAARLRDKLATTAAVGAA